MNQKELEAYNIGKFGLPGDSEARIWETVGERLAWQRGRRERLEAEAREGKPAEPQPEAGLHFETTGEYVRVWSIRFMRIIGIVGIVPGYGTAINAGMRFPDALLPIIAFAAGGGLVGYAMPRLSHALVRALAAVLLRHRLHEPKLGLTWVREGVILGIAGLIYGAFKPFGPGMPLGILTLLVAAFVGVVLGTSLPLFFRAFLDRVTGAARRSA